MNDNNGLTVIQDGQQFVKLPNSILVVQVNIICQFVVRFFCNYVSIGRPVQNIRKIRTAVKMLCNWAVAKVCNRI